MVGQELSLCVTEEWIERRGQVDEKAKRGGRMAKRGVAWLPDGADENPPIADGSWLTHFGHRQEPGLPYFNLDDKAMTLFCRHCGHDVFRIGQNRDYMTFAKCCQCGVEELIHNG